MKNLKINVLALALILGLFIFNTVSQVSAGITPSLTISPPSGTYVTTQNLDLVLIIEGQNKVDPNVKTKNKVV